MNKSIPHRCRSRISTTKERLLAEASSKLESDMRIDILLKKMRIMKGILQKKLDISKAGWLQAERDFGLIYSKSLQRLPTKKHLTKLRSIAIENSDGQDENEDDVFKEFDRLNIQRQ